MASTLSENLGHVPGDRRKLNFGNPRTVGKVDSQNRNEKKNTKKTSGTGHTGDVISDEDSQSGEQGGEDHTSGDNDDDEDHPAGFALSGRMSTPHLTGLDLDDVFNDNTYDNHEDDEDDDYAGLDAISDDEDFITDEGEDGILRMAEKDLIEEFKRSEKPRNTAAVTDQLDQMEIADDLTLQRRVSVQSEDSNYDLELNLDLSMDPFSGLSSNDDLYKEMIEDAESAFDDDLTRWRRPEGPSRENSMQSASQKKVRFESTPSRTSSMSSDDDPRDAYPDLFADLEHPNIRQRNQSGVLLVDAQDAESTYDFDFEDDFEKAALIEDEDDSGEGISTADSDDADDGDTTDEETVDEQLERMREMQKAKGKPIGHICMSTPNTPVDKGRKNHQDSRRSSISGVFETPKSSKKPRSGTFVHDPTRATVSADIKGSGVKVVCPAKPPEENRAYWDRARAAMSSRDGSPRWTRTNPRAPSIPQRPLTAKSTLGTLFDGNLDFLRNNDVAGIAEQLIQHSNNGATGSSFTSTTPTEDEATDDESNVNMADFLQMDDSDSEMDTPMTDSVLSPINGASYNNVNDLASSPIHRRGSGGPGLLDHLEQQRGLVTSFRTNQSRARHISSLASNLSKRAETSEQNALQAGRRSAANTPMTPARKKTASQDLGPTGAGIKKVNSSPMVARRRQSRGNSLSGINATLGLDRF